MRMARHMRTPSHPSGGEGWGEGGVGVAPELDQYCSQHSVEVGHDIGIREAQHAIAAAFKSPGPRRVMGFTAGVRVPVQLDRKALGPGGKVGDIGRKDDLPLELHAQAVGAKPVPETALRLGQVRAQRLGARSRFDVPLDASPLSP